MPRIAFFLMLGLACMLSVAGAQAADDPFTVSNIPVDATAASATVAQNIAINQGKGRAWTTLYRRLTKSQDWPKQPNLDDVTLQRMIKNYVIANERRSTTRYVANVSYEFNPDAVRRLLRSQNIAYVDIEAKPVLVIPMAPGYSPHSAWTQLWTNPRFQTGAVPLVTPVGDQLDTQALGALSFASAQWPDVEPAASRTRASDAFLAQATAGRGNITVAIRRLAPGTSSPIPNVVVPVRPGEPAAQAYGRAADAAAAAIIEVWKSHSAVDFNKRYKLTAEVHISSLAEWGQVMQKLAAIPIVTDVQVLAMNSGEARVAITYVGTPEQLEAIAAQSSLDLSNNAGGWQLAVQTVPVPTPMPAPQ
ncbi:MAG TPA: DUF2066 domain-containing protein [Rhizomicrobium sp.]|nr:DUF2066 domain-containing protein [Rhizomicrobium sp.]